MTSGQPVSVIVVSWNTADLLAACLDAVGRTAGPLVAETIVVDNGSTDGTQAMLRRQFPDVRLIQNDENVGFARANNQALAVCRGGFALLLNSDAFLQPEALAAMLDLARAQPRTGIVGARLLNADGSFQASHTPFPGLRQEILMLTGLGRRIYGPWYPSHPPTADHAPRAVDYVEGACLLVRREAWTDVGGLDEGYFMYAEEVDWCRTMSARGWQVWYHPGATVVHLGGGSSTQRAAQRELDLYRSRIRFFRKHRGRRAATTLKLVIVAISLAKVPVYGVLRLLTGNRRGRRPLPPRRLLARLRSA
jgi:GT2 family glycosyltransferase